MRLVLNKPVSKNIPFGDMLFIVMVENMKEQFFNQERAFTNISNS
jgi:hypothetical protein